MPNIKAKNYYGEYIPREGVEKVWFESADEAGVLVPYSYGEVVEGAQIQPDFSDGDMLVTLPEGVLVREATIAKPENLVPQNVPAGMYIAGVGPGEFVGNTEERTVELDMAGGDQVVLPTAEGVSMSKVTVRRPATLIPENIAEGEYIAGVGPGTHTGGSAPSNEDKPIRFYDPYGEILYAYTKKEIQELEELPAGPALEGVTFESWTHTLDELKAITYFADVGPMYKYGSSPATVLILETIRANTSITLCLYKPSGSATIYWGDGTSSTLKGSSSNTTQTSAHKYSTAGTKIVAIVESGGAYFNLGSANNSYVYNVLYNSTSLQYSNDAYLNSTTNFYLRSVLIGSYTVLSMFAIGITGLCFNSRLKFVSIYSASVTFGGATKQFAHCPGLCVIAGKGYLVGGQYALFSDISLRRLRIQASANANTLIGCDGLKEVEYGSGSINIAKMNVQWSMLMTTTTPPRISAATPIWGTKPIYVPDEALDAYKTAAGWSAAANYIVPASQY